MKDKLPHYIHCFIHFKWDTQNGKVSHKSDILLIIIDLFKNGILSNSCTLILLEFVAAFETNWSKLVITNHTPIFAMPFYQMSSKSFWT